MKRAFQSLDDLRAGFEVVGQIGREVGEGFGVPIVPPSEYPVDDTDRFCNSEVDLH